MSSQVFSVADPKDKNVFYKMLKDVALDMRMMSACNQSCNEIYSGLMPVEING
jgi:hypothetical protein